MNKQYLVIGGVIVAIVLAIGGYFAFSSTTKKQVTTEKETVFEEPSEVIPTVTSSTTVDIKGNKEATITISGVPSGTETIKYDLSYDTQSGNVDGALGTITIEDGADTATEKITFGTCSSGVCRYHSIKGDVRGSFTFTGRYGKKILEKEFAL